MKKAVHERVPPLFQGVERFPTNRLGAAATHPAAGRHPDAAQRQGGRFGKLVVDHDIDAVAVLAVETVGTRLAVMADPGRGNRIRPIQEEADIVDSILRCREGLGDIVVPAEGTRYERVAARVRGRCRYPRWQCRPECHSSSWAGDGRRSLRFRTRNSGSD